LSKNLDFLAEVALSNTSLQPLLATSAPVKLVFNRAACWCARRQNGREVIVSIGMGRKS